MAKLRKVVNKALDQVAAIIDQKLMQGSFSINLVEEIKEDFDNTKMLIRVYERYSMIGNNRLSLSLTLIENNDKTYIYATASGGSRAVFFKINTVGENDFLRKVIDIIDNL